LYLSKPRFPGRGRIVTLGVNISGIHCLEEHMREKQVPMCRSASDTTDQVLSFLGERLTHCP
jgi:hypothetical protein